MVWAVTGVAVDGAFAHGLLSWGSASEKTDSSRSGDGDELSAGRQGSGLRRRGAREALLIDLAAWRGLVSS